MKSFMIPSNLHKRKVVIRGFAPDAEFDAVFFQDRGMDGVFHEVLLLTGILLHVEKLFTVFAFVVDDV